MFHVSCSMFRVSCFVSRMSCLAFGVAGFVLHVSRVLFRVSGVGCRYDTASVIVSTADPTVTDAPRVARTPADARHVTALSDTQRPASACVPPVVHTASVSGLRTHCTTEGFKTHST